jgi:hypothetical protein
MALREVGREDDRHWATTPIFHADPRGKPIVIAYLVLAAAAATLYIYFIIREDADDLETDLTKGIARVAMIAGLLLLFVGCDSSPNDSSPDSAVSADAHPDLIEAGAADARDDMPIDAVANDLAGTEAVMTNPQQGTCVEPSGYAPEAGAADARDDMPIDAVANDLAGTEAVMTNLQQGTCVQPRGYAPVQLDIETCNGNEEEALCTWHESDGGDFRVSDCHPNPNVTCVAACPAPFAACDYFYSGDTSVSSCWPPSSGGVCFPDSFSYDLCYSDKSKAICTWASSGLEGSVLKTSGCAPADGIECVSVCP